ncbi:DnaJ C-terminal domain-containing protein [Facilibium subflavum]|uniref:DnaJ C-terminal domain-containing protein n=1 Tax=Facilibium subflavum TaxID=2219058 RepID=UPI000E65D729|nr:DnaJ C-terminal domain-containing protein [Facilibium subflavum]
MSGSYYDLLGVAKSASDADIKKAYRRLAKKYHPDVSTEADAEAKFKEIQTAYSVLKDPQKRKLYDQFGENWEQAQAGGFQQSQGQGGFSQKSHGGGFHTEGQHFYENFGDYEDIFGEFFKQTHQKRSQQQGHFRADGQDLHTQVSISVLEALNGVERQLHFRYQALDDNGYVTEKTKKLKVKIPKGVGNHQQIRLKGQGGKAMGQGKDGDLYLEVIVESTSQYQVVGNDLYSHIPIAPWEAALGAEITVPTPHGKMKLKVPAHTQSGKKMRLKGKGLAKGDFYVVLDVILPPAVSDSQKAFYQKMADEMAFDPRKDLLGA